MVFSSFDFLLKFLPVFLIAYYLTPKQSRNLTLFVFSVVFYAYGAWKTPLYILILLVNIVMNWRLALGMKKKRGRRLRLVVAVCYDLFWLVFFKYSYFFGILPVKLVLPIGISFYTFQMISYVADVYMRKTEPETKLLNTAVYIMMFPQLIAGPIVRFTDIREQLVLRRHTVSRLKDGLKVFAVGLGSKVILANQIGNLWNDINSIGYDSITVPMAWLGLLGYSLQLYFDFYGYSLMAIGLGRMCGFEICENFDCPYIASSMTEFWRRWHISLGTWFREYVYIPLGGNRKGLPRQLCNLFAVWMLTGLWHGADWNFVLWGFSLFLIMSAEKLGLLTFLKKHRIFAHIYTIMAAMLTWMIFAIDDMKSLAVYAGRLIGIGSEWTLSNDWINALGTYGWLIAIGIICCTPLPRALYRKYKKNAVTALVCVVIFGISVYCLYKGMNDPFLYFRF